MLFWECTNIQENTVLEINRPKSTWAGLRSFVSDGEPALGYDPLDNSFFWAAALGGYGIQTAPAVGQLCAALLQGSTIPETIEQQGLELTAIGLARFPRSL